MTADVPPIRLSWRFALEFLADGRTPQRALADAAIVAFARAIQGEVSEMIELGAGGFFYRDMLRGIVPVKTSNMFAGFDLVIDMTSIALPDQSVEAFLSCFAFEHVFEFERSFSEVARTLKPGGYYLLVVPFLYFYHAAPDDYFRYTQSALVRLSEKHGLDVVHYVPLGDRPLLFAEFFHEKIVLGSKYGWLARTLLRLLALPFLVVTIARNHPDPRFAGGHALLLRRRGAGGR